MKKRIVGVLVAWFLVFLPFSARAEDLRTEAKVDEVLSRVQSRSGQKVEWLVDLGPEAVPAICKRLKTYAFPMELVKALGELGDRRATRPLLDLLADLDPSRSDPGITEQCVQVVVALKEIGDPAAEERLQEIAASDSADLRVRLYAAGALARFGSREAKQDAQAFIMGLAAERSKYIRSVMDWDFLPEDLYVALCEVATHEALDMVVSVLGGDAMSYEKMAILKHLPTTEYAPVVATLLDVSACEDNEGHLRLAALERLITLEEKVSTEQLRSRLEALGQDELIDRVPEYRDKFTALMKRLLEREQREKQRPTAVSAPAETIGQTEAQISTERAEGPRRRMLLIWVGVCGALGIGIALAAVFAVVSKRSGGKRP